MNVKVCHGAPYVLTLIDGYIHRGYIYLLSQCLKTLNSFKRFVENLRTKQENDKTIKEQS